MVREAWARVMYALSTILYGLPEIRPHSPQESDPSIMRHLTLYRVGVKCQTGTHAHIMYNHFKMKPNPIERFVGWVRYRVAMVRCWIKERGLTEQGATR